MKFEYFVNLLFALVFYVFNAFLINAVQGWKTKLGLIILTLCFTIGYILCWKLERSIDQPRKLRKHKRVLKE